MNNYLCFVYFTQNSIFFQYLSIHINNAKKHKMMDSYEIQLFKRNHLKLFGK